MSKPRGYWTFERCKEEAADYPTRSAWKSSSYSSYQRAAKRDWLKECCHHMYSPHKPHAYWTFELCKIEALKCQSKDEWKKNSSYSYSLAYQKKWLKDL